ncbi:hypothetical protein RB653_006984 [Dictyostelium firmibasis]|uniref:Armadillo repeat-containing protein 8 n=1 Tax=Dictyostelium firmibasis TaxID=79012 RepID=A0AAN7U0G5_9MYCE
MSNTPLYTLDENCKQSLNILSPENRGLYNEENRIQSAKFIKNTIIGNKLKKRLFIEAGAIPLFVDILNKEKNEDLLIQASSVIGSFGCRIDEGSEKIFEHNGVTPLINLLSSNNLKLVESAARSLKILSLFHQPPSSIYEESGVKLLISLFNHPLDSVKEVAATIIARGCESLYSNNNNNNNNNNNSNSNGNIINHSFLQYQNFVHIHGGLNAVMSILASPRSKIQEACLYVISWLTRDNVQLSTFIVNDERRILDIIIYLFKKNKSPKIKLLATNCLCNFNQSKTLPITCSLKNILPIIIRLMSEEESVKEDAPMVLARLVADSEDLQRIASEAEAISRLSIFLKDSNSSERLKENSLSAIAVLCSSREDSRKQVVDAKIIPQIISSLNSTNYAIRAAACNCTKSLSRSIKQLRTSLFDCTIATPLLRLLDDQSLEVRVSASATLCNLVLDFSPMKQAIMDNGIIVKLVQLTQDSNDFKIRLNCIWALKNLLYMAEPSLKEQVMKELGYQRLIELIKDIDPSISEQALAVLRNLAFKDNDHLISELHFHDQLVPTIENRLASNIPEIIKQTLFVICNIAGNEKIRASVMNSSIINRLIHFMEHKHCEIRIASVWCVCNIIGPDDNSTSAGRVLKFKELGYQKKLEMLADHDSNIEVKDRVKTALALFKKCVFI